MLKEKEGFLASLGMTARKYLIDTDKDGSDQI